ncbi:MAG: tetratricopeptide repeat protein [Planctomycetota bacterium]
MTNPKAGWSLIERVLVGIIVIELIVVGYLRIRSDEAVELEVTVPRPALEQIDTLAAAEIGALCDRVQEALEQGLEPPGDWAELADAYLAFGFLEAAEACYRRGLVRRPDNYRLNKHLGFCLDARGKTNEAIAVFEHAARVGADKKQRVEARYHVGQNLLQALRPADAVQVFDVEAPHYVGVHFQLAKVLLRLNRLAEAKAYTDSMARDFPQVANLLLLRARIEEALENDEGARDLRDRVAWAPISMPLDGGIARFLEGTRDRYGAWRGFQEAARLFQRDRSAAIALMEKSLAAEWHVDPAMQLAIMYHQEQRPADAVALLELAQQRWGGAPRRDELLGESHRRLGNLPQARASWERSLRLRPTASVHRKLAALFPQLKEPELAQHHRTQADYRQGVEHYRAGRLPEAAASLSAAVKSDQQLADAWFYLGEAQRARGDAAAAEHAYRQCHAADAEHPRIHSRLPAGQ